MAIMVLARKSNVNTILFLSLSLLLISAVHGRRSLLDNPNNVFDVKLMGADFEGFVDTTTYFQKAWSDACHSNGPSRVVIPPGDYVISNLNFEGPCTSKPITIEIQGNILAHTNLANFGDSECLLISKVEGLLVTGSGTFNGQGAGNWKDSDCKKNPNCIRMPVSLKFSFITDGVVENIKLVESKGFHMTITNCTNFVARGLHITAFHESPNTDGIHISRSNNVTITSSVIGSGDDCISIGEGSRNIEINHITCGPGHGISIGSIGKPRDDGISGIHVAHCLLKGTTNGARIKTFHNSPAIDVSNIVFEDITMENVTNPIIIDQHYQAKNKKPSMVKLSDIHFRNIRGTTPSSIAVSLNCSDGVPCQGVELVDIDLSFNGIIKPKTLPFSAGCANVQGFTFLGKQNPPAPQCL